MEEDDETGWGCRIGNVCFELDHITRTVTITENRGSWKYDRDRPRSFDQFLSDCSMWIQGAYGRAYLNDVERRSLN